MLKQVAMIELQKTRFILPTPFIRTYISIDVSNDDNLLKPENF